MSFSEYWAIRWTAAYARSTGWPAYADQVCDALGLRNPKLTATEFVDAVEKWQRAHRPLDADGILGPMTWAKLSPPFKKGAPPAPSARFAASAFLANLKAAATGRRSGGGAKAGPISVGPSNADDELLKQMAWEAVNNTDLHVAYPVSAAEVARAAKMGGSTVMYTGSMVAPQIKAGQKWPAPKGGYRIVMAVAQPDVYFITDSGRTYSENVQGWVDDYIGVIYSDLAASLAPLETILDVEADFLLGAISATGLPGAVLVIGMSATQWALNHKEAIVNIGEAIAVALTVRKTLKTFAPTLYDKIVSWGTLWKVLQDVPDSLASNPAAIAKLVGQLLVSAGKIALERDPSALIDIVKPISKELIKGLKAGLEYGAIAALKQIPNAAKLAAVKESLEIMKTAMIDGMAKAGFSLSANEADAIIKEIAAHPKEIARALVDFEDAFKDLKLD